MDGSAIAMVPTTPCQARLERLPRAPPVECAQRRPPWGCQLRHLVPGLEQAAPAIVCGAVPGAFARVRIGS